MYSSCLVLLTECVFVMHGVVDRVFIMRGVVDRVFIMLGVVDRVCDHYAWCC